MSDGVGNAAVATEVVQPMLMSAPGRYRGAMWRLYRSEMRLILTRRRNLVLLIAFACVPILVGLAVYFFGGDAGPHGGTFVGRLTGNGMFLMFVSLLVSVPVFLPVGVGIVSGDAIAGESGAGTLRYLLTVPVSRTRVLLVKALGALTSTVLAVVAISIVGLLTGGILFGFGPVTLLSGDTISYGAGLGRAAIVAIYVVLSMTGLITVGLLCSTMTEMPIAAMAATVVIPVVSTVLDNLPQLSAIHPGLLTHHWLDFVQVLSVQVNYADLARGLIVQVVWVAVVGSLAWARLTTMDITS